MGNPGRNDPCPCGSGMKYKRCCVDAPPPMLRTTPANRGAARAPLSLVVETTAGAFERRIPNASPLRRDIRDGAAAEDATQDAAALWGLPDFVFHAEQRRTASGVREIGDGIVLVGALGIVVQVKSRESCTEDPDKETRWIRKHVAKALSQGDGTVRNLKQQNTRLTNVRGATVDVVGDDRHWVVVVVVNHDAVPDDITIEAVAETTTPSVVLLRRDWEFCSSS